MIQLPVIMAALRDLVLFIPILIIVAVLSAFGIVFKIPQGRHWGDDYDDKS